MVKTMMSLENYFTTPFSSNIKNHGKDINS
jgi:hypothetical protein